MRPAADALYRRAHEKRLRCGGEWRVSGVQAGKTGLRTARQAAATRLRCATRGKAPGGRHSARRCASDRGTLRARSAAARAAAAPSDALRKGASGCVRPARKSARAFKKLHPGSSHLSRASSGFAGFSANRSPRVQRFRHVCAYPARSAPPKPLRARICATPTSPRRNSTLQRLAVPLASTLSLSMQACRRACAARLLSAGRDAPAALRCVGGVASPPEQGSSAGATMPSAPATPPPERTGRTSPLYDGHVRLSAPQRAAVAVGAALGALWSPARADLVAALGCAPSALAAPPTRPHAPPAQGDHRTRRAGAHAAAHGRRPRRRSHPRRPATHH